MTTKKELQEKVQNLLQQATDLQKQLEEFERREENAPSLLRKPVPGSGENYFSLQCEGASGIAVTYFKANSDIEPVYSRPNIFMDESQAKDYAKALETFLKLRHCKGTTVIDMDEVDNGEYYNIVFDGKVVYADWWTDSTSYRNNICPTFIDEESAEAAIKEVGKDNIIHMLKTFNPVKEQ